MTDLLFVPELDSKLVSVPALTARGVLAQFEHQRARLSVDGSVVAVIPKIGKLFMWRTAQEAVNVASEANAAGSEGMMLWHAQLGHVSYAKSASVRKACDGIPRIDNSGDHDGPVCGGKMTDSPYSHKSGSEVKTSAPFDLVYSDVVGQWNRCRKVGPSTCSLLSTITCAWCCVFLKTKSEVFERFKGFKTLVETQYGRRIRCIRSDNGGEYTSKRFNQFCALAGIVHQTTAPYLPQQNDLAERMNRTLAEGARSVMFYMEVDRAWWAEAIRLIAHIINRIPNTAWPDTSPMEIVVKKKPVLDYLRVFGA